MLVLAWCRGRLPLLIVAVAVCMMVTLGEPPTANARMNATTFTAQSAARSDNWCIKDGLSKAIEVRTDPHQPWTSLDRAPNPLLGPLEFLIPGSTLNDSLELRARSGISGEFRLTLSSILTHPESALAGDKNITFDVLIDGVPRLSVPGSVNFSNTLITPVNIPANQVTRLTVRATMPWVDELDDSTNKSIDEFMWAYKIDVGLWADGCTDAPTPTPLASIRPSTTVEQSKGVLPFTGAYILATIAAATGILVTGFLLRAHRRRKEPDATQ